MSKLIFDGYTFSYDPRRKADTQEKCNHPKCQRKRLIEVRRDAGGELMYFCFSHLIHYFPKYLIELNKNHINYVRKSYEKGMTR